MTSSTTSSKCVAKAEKHISHCHIIPTKPACRSLKTGVNTVNEANVTSLTNLSSTNIATNTSSSEESCYSNISACKR